MTDTTTTTTTTTGGELDGATADPGPLSFTLPAELAAAAWQAVAAVVAKPRDRRPILEGVHAATGPDGVTLTGCDTFAAHRVTLPRTLDGATLPFLPHAPAMLPAWKAADVARIAKGAAAVRFTAAADRHGVARCEALDAAGAVVGSLAAPAPGDADAWPAFTGLWEREGWPDALDVVGFCPARLARSMTAADRFRGKNGGPAVVDTVTPLKPARFTLPRLDGAALTVVIMAHKLPPGVA